MARIAPRARRATTPVRGALFAFFFLVAMETPPSLVQRVDTTLRILRLAVQLNEKQRATFEHSPFPTGAS